MNRYVLIAVLAADCILGVVGCKRESNENDRTQADEMYARICALTKEYTAKLQSSPDSTDWVATCHEFEEKLDKISFSYPPDTDILLTEGQNDTIYTLMQEYAKERGRRVHGFVYPEDVPDTVESADSVSVEVQTEESIGGSTGASHSPGN